MIYDILPTLGLSNNPNLGSLSTASVMLDADRIIDATIPGYVYKPVIGQTTAFVERDCIIGMTADQENKLNEQQTMSPGDIRIKSPVNSNHVDIAQDGLKMVSSSVIRLQTLSSNFTTDELRLKINEIVGVLNTLIGLYNTHTHPETGSVTSPTTNLATTVATNF